MGYTFTPVGNAVQITNGLGYVAAIQGLPYFTTFDPTSPPLSPIVNMYVGGEFYLKFRVNEVETVDGNPAASDKADLLEQLTSLFYKVYPAGGGGGSVFINAGDGINVSGTGTSDDPFIITNTGTNIKRVQFSASGANPETIAVLAGTELLSVSIESVDQLISDTSTLGTNDVALNPVTGSLQYRTISAGQNVFIIAKDL